MSKFKKLSKACAITDKIYQKLIKEIESFKTEKDIEKFILNEIKKRNLRPSFMPVIGTGKNASNPHNSPSEEKLRGFTFIDFGVKYKSYCSDLTRTVYFGLPSKEEIKKYRFVKKIQEKVLKQIRIGSTYRDLDVFVRKEMGSWENFLIHPLGHGIGTRVHIYPKITSKFNSDLSYKTIRRLKNIKVKEDDSFTIEPGIYKKDCFGIRIEDVVFMKKNKPIILSKASKKFLIFKKP